MNMFCRSSFILFVLLSIAGRSMQLDSLADRCAASVTGFVCNDCLNTYDCVSGALVPCESTMLCDANYYDGTCLPPNFAFSDSCQCSTVGCEQDPNNDNAGMTCSVIDDSPTSTTSCTSGEVINLDTCLCDQLQCPLCGLLPGDPSSSCSPTFIVCDDGLNLEYPCPDATCFDSDVCHCRSVVGECPACGFVIDESATDGSFCNCITVPPICGLQCPVDQAFNEVTCGCDDGGGTGTTVQPTGNTGVTPPTGDPTIPPTGNTGVTPQTGDPTITGNPDSTLQTGSPGTVQCSDCGVGKVTDTDCSPQYYLCDPVTNQILSGPYSCIAGLCVNIELCVCEPPEFIQNIINNV